MTTKFGVIGVLAAALSLGALPAARAGADLGVFGAYLDSDTLQEAYGGGARLKFDLAQFFALDIRGSYLEYSDADVSVIPLEGMALLQLPLGDALTLYGGVGAGYYLFDGDRLDLEDSVGYFPVAGLEVKLGGAKLFGEVRWLSLSADVDSAQDELEDLVDGGETDADGFGVNIGLAFDL